MSSPAEGAKPGNSGALPNQIRVLGQYVRDLSFENFLLQRNEWKHKPTKFQVNVNLDSHPVKDKVFMSVLRLQLTANEEGSGDPIYCLELDYCGLFGFDGIGEQHIRPLLMVECPRILFPFVRRIIHDTTRDGGFPPFNLEMLDFAGMFNAAIQQQGKEAQGKGTGN